MGNCHFKTDFDAENITGKLRNTSRFITLTITFLSIYEYLRGQVDPFNLINDLIICRYVTLDTAFHINT